MLKKMAEIFADKTKEEINMAMSYAMQINDTRNKTECLNAEYHMGRFAAFMDILEELDMDAFVEIGDNTRQMRQFISEGVNKIYG